MAKPITVDTSVEIITLAKDGVLEEQILKNDGKAENPTRPYEQILSYEETTKVTSFNRRNDKVSISIDTTTSEMHLVICVFDTGVGQSLIREKVFRQALHKKIKSAHAPDLKSATSQSVHALGIISLHVRMGDCRVLCSSV